MKTYYRLVKSPPLPTEGAFWDLLVFLIMMAIFPTIFLLLVIEVLFDRRVLPAFLFLKGVER